MSLIDLMPEYYRNSPEVIAFQAALDGYAEAIGEARDSVLAQLNVDTATWGLDLWEQELGIISNSSDPPEYRRSRIKGKLRGVGTATVDTVKNIAESYANGEVEIIERPSEYCFDVKFVGNIGVPPNMDDFTAALEDIKPAHLCYQYIYVYITHREVGQCTHAQLKGYTHYQIRTGETNDANG